MKTNNSYLSLAARLFVLAAIIFPAFGPSVPQAAAQTNTLTLSVISARTEPLAPGGPVAKGDPVTEYKYLINVDNTGDPSSFTLTDTPVTHNTGTSGAGILNTGGGATGTIRDTSISYNTATYGGGGVNNNGSLTITGITLDHNQAHSGGGIDHNGSSIQLTNNTISQNSVSGKWRWRV